MIKSKYKTYAVAQGILLAQNTLTKRQKGEVSPFNSLDAL